MALLLALSNDKSRVTLVINMIASICFVMGNPLSENYNYNYCSVQNYCVSGSSICEIFTVISLQEGVGWEIFTVIWGSLLGSNIDSQDQQTHSELQD